MSNLLGHFLFVPGLFEVGVHIADVSYFLRPHTALDRTARQRATSVYLVQKVTDLTVYMTLCCVMFHKNNLHWNNAKFF